MHVEKESCVNLSCGSYWSVVVIGVYSGRLVIMSVSGVHVIDINMQDIDTAVILWAESRYVCVLHWAVVCANYYRQCIVSQWGCWSYLTFITAICCCPGRPTFWTHAAEHATDCSYHVLLLCKKLLWFLGKATKTVANRATIFGSNMH